MKGIFCKISSTIRCLSAKQLAEAIFQLLVSAFDDYAEGYNYLGLIALEQRQYKKAVEHFEKTVTVGRNLFPRRLPKKDYWLDHSTRPFM